MTEITNKIYYVGVNDRNKHRFEGLWPLPNGVSYNSYIIDDEKVALVDTVEVRAENGFAKSYPSEKMKPVSTIGAGDNFNAGFVFGLIKDGITREDIDRGLSEAQWDSLLASAQDFSTECCKDIYNYVSKEFGERKNLEL